MEIKVNLRFFVKPFQASGVAVSDTSIRAYEEIRNGKAHRFAIFMISGNKIDIDQVGKERFRNYWKMSFPKKKNNSCRQSWCELWWLLRPIESWRRQTMSIWSVRLRIYISTPRNCKCKLICADRPISSCLFTNLLSLGGDET